MLKKIPLVLSLALILAIQGCATGAKTGAMIVPLSEQTIIEPDSILFQNINVDEVSGGKDTNPAWTSKVSNENFSEALSNTLKLHSMFAEDEVDYSISAELQNLKQPLLGFDITVTAEAFYQVTSNDNQEVVFETEIISPYTAPFGDAMLGVKRLRLANEGAIRENISEFIRQIIEFFEGE